MRVREIADAQEFQSLEGVWNELVDKSPEHLFWLRHEQVRLWLDFFGRPEITGQQTEPFILLVYDDEELVAIAPLMRRTIKLFGISIRAITFLGHGRREIIISKKKKEVMLALLAYLRRVKHSWIDMNMIPEGSEQIELLEQEALRKKIPTRRAESYTGFNHLYLPIGSDWEEYLKSLSKKFKYNLNRAERELKELGQVEYEECRASKDLEPIFAGLMQVETHSWRQGQDNRVMNFTTGPFLNFALQFLAEAAKRRYLNIFFLKLDGMPIAYYVTISYRNRLLSIWTSYDQNYRKYSPGQLLLFYVLKGCFATKYEQYDFLGHFEYETRWTNSAQSHGGIKIYKNRLMALLDNWILSKSKMNWYQDAQIMQELRS